MKEMTIDSVLHIVQLGLLDKAKSRGERGIPRFSSKHATVYDYLKEQIDKGKIDPGKKFDEQSPYMQRILRKAMQSPHYTLEDMRGHGKPTGAVFKCFDSKGEKTIMFKNREQESLYASYLNAVKKYQMTGDYSDLQKFKGKTYIEFIPDKPGSKTGKFIERKFITSKRTLKRLELFGELPGGDDIYAQ